MSRGSDGKRTFFKTELISRELQFPFLFPSAGTIPLLSSAYNPCTFRSAVSELHRTPGKKVWRK